MENILHDDIIISKIYYIREQKVMLDEDLAELYQIPTKRLNEQVERNSLRFPEDFSFRLTELEFENLKSQLATSSWGGRRKLPVAFTEHGVLQLSSVLNSDIAIKVNIQIIRIFNRMRQMLLTHKDILLKLEELDKKITGHDEAIKLLFDCVKELMQSPKPAPRRMIGFKRDSQ
jgi:hypothetical protein